VSVSRAPSPESRGSAILPRVGRPLAIALTTVLMAASHVAADWPQFLGPDRNGVYRGTPIVSSFPQGGPKVVWTRKVGQGLSGPVVVGNRLVLFHRVGDREVVESLDIANGTTQWQYGYPTAYRDDFGFDEGPRAVPVVVDGVVYTFGAEGQLHAITLDRGQRLWSENTAQKFGVAKGFFGAAGSPLVENGRVIANVGGAKAGIIAFNAKTGKVEWTATEDAASYSSPAAATIAGQRFAVFLTRAGLVGLDPASGAVKFQRAWRARANASVNAATPVVVGNLIFISAEYGPGAGVLRLDGSTLTEVWSSNDVLSNHYATSVYADGVLYGFHGRQEFGQTLRAVDFRTGRVRWSEDRFGAGTLTLAGDQLIVMREDGELVLAPVTPAGFRPTARARVLSATVRAYPAIDSGFLYARNDNTLVCLDLRR
jgi:outer membrane protein assembly factor BamB